MMTELFGGEGDDRLWGDFGKATDPMLAYQGRDYLDGEAGNDQLAGGGNNDTLMGGTGDDALWGDDTQGLSAGVGAWRRLPRRRRRQRPADGRRGQRHALRQRGQGHLARRRPRGPM